MSGCQDGTVEVVGGIDGPNVVGTDGRGINGPINYEIKAPWMKLSTELPFGAWTASSLDALASYERLLEHQLQKMRLQDEQLQKD